MVKPIIDNVSSQEARIVWQQLEEDGSGMPEPAILVEFYNDTIALTQENNVINLNYETVEEFCRLLRKGKSKS